ncbi:MAG: EpsG family protein [Ruminococcus sp.]|nr:EpsG family protein [Ruminococcus sp.]
MAILIVIMAITLLFFRSNENKKDRKVCVSVITTIMACFSGLRAWWMGDLIKYFTLYRNCNGDDWYSFVFDDRANIGIRLFFRLIGSVGLSYDVCIFMIAAFSAIALGIVIYRYSPAPYWSYLMYIAMGFYLFTFSGLKQTIAMGFLMFAAIGIFEDKPKKFVVFTVIAAIFHAPAIIFIAAYPIAKKKIDKTYFIIFIVTVICVFIFKDQIVSWLGESYYDGEQSFTESKTIGGRALMMILIIALGAFLRPPREGDRTYCKVFNLMMVAVVIQYFSIYDNGFTRLADYYYQFIVLFMPMMLESGQHQLEMNSSPAYKVKCHDQSVYLFLSVAITVFALWFYDSTIDASQIILQDYKFFWEIDPYSLYGS